MGHYKHTLRLDETRAQDDCSVMGSEFVNFLSSVPAFGTLRRFDRAGLLGATTHGAAMKILRRAKKARVGGERAVLERLGIMERPAPANKPYIVP